MAFNMCFSLVPPPDPTKTMWPTPEAFAAKKKKTLLVVRGLTLSFTLLENLQTLNLELEKIQLFVTRT